MKRNTLFGIVSIVAAILFLMVIIKVSYKVGYKYGSANGYKNGHDIVMDSVIRAESINSIRITDTCDVINRVIYQDSIYGEVFVITSDLPIEEIDRNVRYLYPNGNSLKIISKVITKYK